MAEKWTGDLIGRMHNAGVTRLELATELGVGKAYITMILNGSRTPPNAKERLNGAFRAVLEKRRAQTETEGAQT